MERDRVVAVTGSDGRGSGYVVGPRLVLTSAHVVGPAVTVFRPGRRGTFTARTVWRGTPGGRDDAALVLVDDPAWVPVPGGITWGRTVTYRPSAWQAWGMPELVRRAAADTAQLTGTLNPGTRLVADRYVLELDTFPPEGSSPWAGMSGAAVFCGDLLVGVVAVDPAGRRHAALEAVPAYVLLDDEDFAASVGTPVCEAVELRQLTDARAVTPAGVPTPAALLTARRAVVPFHGRQDVLADLHAWAARPGAGVWLLHGPGGQGKTRLAHEFGEQLSWAVVWLSPDASAEVLADTVAPVLVVVDYAENRAAQLAAVFTALARRESTVAVKVLLLARTAGTWWDELAATGGHVVRDIAELTAVRELTRLDATPDARADAYRAAVTAFAAALPRIPGLADHDWPVARLCARPPAFAASTALAVQMTALADLLGTPTDAPVEDRLLNHERGYWLSTAAARGLGLTLATLTDVVVATAVLGPSTMDDLDAVVSRVPGTADQPADRRGAVRTWLAGLYPAGGDGTFEGLAPDRLAERLVGRSIIDGPGVVEKLAAEVTGDEAVRLLTVCVRAAAHSGDKVGDRLTRWCVRHPETLLTAAIGVATQVEAPAPLVRALEQVADSGDIDTAVLAKLYDVIPDRSQTLAEAAAAVIQALANRRRKALTDNPDHDGSGLALALISLSFRMGELGRWEAALAAAAEAVEVYRGLAGQHPDVYLHPLAMSLNNLSVDLRAAGRSEEALVAGAEAVEVFRGLAEQDPAVYRSHLARTLNNFSVQLDDLGRKEEALAAIAEAVEVFRGAAEERLHLGMSLNNLSVVLSGLGRQEDALAASAETVEVYRGLAQQAPDAHLPNLASGLNNLALRFAVLGRREEALAAITECVDIRRTLAERRPEPHLGELERSQQVLALLTES